MKKETFFIFLFATAFSFSQQGQNPLLVRSSFNYKLAPPTSLKPGLNMGFFKLKDFKQNTLSSTELPQRSNDIQTEPGGNMPNFRPHGKFFIEIYGIDETMDYKLKVFDLKKPKG